MIVSQVSQWGAHDQSNMIDDSSDSNEMSIPVPLPTEIPAPPNLSQLPAHILHSGTVETLIGQNEDLMARLKVNLRRNSVIEQQLMEQERLHQELARVNNSLMSQLQVFQEKDRLVREKNQSSEDEKSNLRDEVELLRVKLNSVEERRDELHAGLKFENSYRRRIRTWVRPFINDLKNQLKDATTRVSFLDRQLAVREAAVGDLRARLSDTITHFQGAQRDHSADQASLIEKYETKIKDTESEFNKANAELKLLREKATNLESAISARAEAENRIILLERRAKDFEAHAKELEEQMIGFRKEAKAIATEHLATKSILSQVELERDSSREAFARLQDQFESLQTVWAESQKKHEATRLQQDTLNSLNQELGRQLKTERKMRESAEQAAKNVTPVATPRVAVTTAAPRAIARAATPAPLTSDLEAKDRMGKIDTLLAELESGFAKARVLDAQLNGLEIIEDEEKSPTRRSAADENSIGG